MSAAKIAQSAYRWARGWTEDELGFESRQAQKIFLYSKEFRPALGPTLPPIQWVPGGGGVLPPGVKRPGREANHTPLPRAEVKNM
jgi:hypothetical protein